MLSFFSSISESSKLSFAFFIFVATYVICTLELFQYENPRNDRVLLEQILREVQKIPKPQEQNSSKK